MSDETRGELTQGQQRFMERMQEAQNEGVSLPDYYRAHLNTLRPRPFKPAQALRMLARRSIIPAAVHPYTDQPRLLRTPRPCTAASLQRESAAVALEADCTITAIVRLQIPIAHRTD